ncbi:deoxynucleoside triphosphate triphosphohydrolase SAMHD1-like [Dreissena polymorpha]|uniref:deoxynucleoside triphosphate triphosphohydrolase SAMHD1-like n=1 Tax=Dreissena polymorpha TaxID=45954 RepID=UPI002264B7B5|nr:deoxynucleoside triphosphate triphosphohydrolase SAMHD1-like [Dreissena polymorpha]
MSQAVDDMKVLSKLTDDVFNVILNSTKPELRESREILRNVLSRELPKFVREKPLPGNYADDKESIEKIKQNMNIPRTEYIIQVANLDFGMKTENPINTQETDPINNQQADPINNQETSPIQKMLFYRKHNFDVAQTEETQLFPPVRNKEKLVRVFSTKKYPESCEHVDQKFCEAMEKMARERPADEGPGERSVERNQQEVIVPNIAVISDRGFVSQVHFKVKHHNSRNYYDWWWN